MKDSNYDNCKIEVIEKWLNCSLPWGSKTSKNNEKFRIENYPMYFFLGLNMCTTDQQFKRYMQLTYNTTLLNEQLKKGKCEPISCKESTWKYKVMLEAHDLNLASTKKLLTSLQSYDKDTHMIVHITMNSVWVDKIVHVKIYGFPQFIADFGGYLGLLLGGSILAMYDELVTFFQYIYAKLKKYIFK